MSSSRKPSILLVGCWAYDTSIIAATPLVRVSSKRAFNYERATSGAVCTTNLEGHSCALGDHSFGTCSRGVCRTRCTGVEDCDAAVCAGKLAIDNSWDCHKDDTTGYLGVCLPIPALMACSPLTEGLSCVHPDGSFGICDDDHCRYRCDSAEDCPALNAIITWDCQAPHEADRRKVCVPEDPLYEPFEGGGIHDPGCN
jgi:hypothetical protein